jgi:hypothetical protein
MTYQLKDQETGDAIDFDVMDHKTARAKNAILIKQDSDYRWVEVEIAPTTRYPMPAEDESFSDWQDRRTTNGGR